MSEKLFVYGTLKDPTVQQELLGRVFYSQKVILEDYETSNVEVEDETFPAQVPKYGSIVDGLVLEVSK